VTLSQPMNDATKGAAALTKGIKLLTVIAEAEAPLSVRELSELTALPRPTVYRLLAVLSDAGLIRQSSSGHTFKLGMTLVSIAHRALDQTDIRDIAHEHLLKLRDETGETVHLAVYSNGAMLYVDNIESHERVRMKCSLGTTVPMHSTAVGKAHIAFSLPHERERILERLDLHNVTGLSITSLDELRTEIADVQRRGWSTDEEENERDIFCFGAPILDRNGLAAAAISISIPRFRMRAKVESTYIEPLIRTTTAISRVLGHRPGAAPGRKDSASK